DCAQLYSSWRRFLGAAAGGSSFFRPDPARGLNHQAELGPLFIFGQQIPFRGGGEAALRAESQVLQGNIAGCLLDPSRYLGAILQLGTLGADQAKDNHLPFGNEAERFECPRTLVVIFQKKTIGFESPKEFFGDRVIPAFRVPMAAIVAAAEMNREQHARPASSGEASIVGAYGFLQQPLRLNLHLGANPLPPLGVDKVAVAGRVNLN